MGFFFFFFLGDNFSLFSKQMNPLEEWQISMLTM